MRHISGQDNVDADALSRVESVNAPPFHEALAAAQNSEDELRTLLGANNALRLEKQPSAAPPSPSTATPLPENLGLTFRLHYDS
jgi:hypothetical protein